MRSRVLLLSTLSMLAGLAPAADAQVMGYRLHEPFMFPSIPSLRDERWLVIVDDCGESRLREPVTLRQVVGGNWKLEATPVAPSYLCFAVPGGPGTAVHAIRIRNEVLHASQIDVTIDAPDSRGFEGSVSLIGSATSLPPSIDGAWHDPGNPGQGLYLALTPMQNQSGIVALWSTYDRTGAPLWLTGAALNRPLQPYVAEVPLFSAKNGSFPGTGTTAPRVEAWGQLRLEYLGCHRLKVDWQATDGITFPAGSREFQQFTADVTHECDIAAYARSMGRELFVYEPVIISQ